MNDKIQDMLDRNDLLELVNRYARGLDRCDVDALHDVFFDDAQVDMISHAGSARDFVVITLEALRENAVMSSHLTSNSIFEIEGDRAIGESYLISWSVMKADGQPVPATHIGRYLDRFERRDGVWKFIYRKVIIDLSLLSKISDGINFELPDAESHRHPADAVYGERAWLTEGA